MPKVQSSVASSQHHLSLCRYNANFHPTQIHILSQYLTSSTFAPRRHHRVGLSTSRFHHIYIHQEGVFSDHLQYSIFTVLFPHRTQTRQDELLVALYIFEIYRVDNFVAQQTFRQTRNYLSFVTGIIIGL